ncbi:MAG: hypothetical protein J3R72DRAFT_432542 [Linnemannia gamsii]|nr:MAG: hypothetical protein J3R72DRAFT_432542 [Linnemannia gamsii]
MDAIDSNAVYGSHACSRHICRCWQNQTVDRLLLLLLSVVVANARPTHSHTCVCLCVDVIQAWQRTFFLLLQSDKQLKHRQCGRFFVLSCSGQRG